MGNPDDGRTTINVKGVTREAWERARAAATKSGEAMGAWLSRAVDQLARLEAGPREFPPALAVKPTNNSGNPDADARLIDLLTAAATLSTACGGKLSAVPGLTALCAERVRSARGLPPLAARRPPRRAVLASRIGVDDASGLNGGRA